MKTNLTILLLTASLCISGCFDEKSESTTSDQSKQTSSSKSVNTDGKVLISITKLEASGDDCNVVMKMHNQTKKKVRTYQMRNIDVVTTNGITNVEHSNNYPLEIGEAYTRGGIMVYDASCKSISELRVKETLCSYEVPMSEYDKRFCENDVVYQGTRKVKFVKQ